MMTINNIVPRFSLFMSYSFLLVINMEKYTVYEKRSCHTGSAIRVHN